MKAFLSRFTVMIERRALKRAVALLTAAATALTSTLVTTAIAAPVKAKNSKIAKDLQHALTAPTTPKAIWVRDIRGVRMVQVVISTQSAGMDMKAVRDAIKAAGGSVHVRMPGLRMVTATVPAPAVAGLAARSDVDYVVTNRAVQRTSSTLEMM